MLASEKSPFWTPVPTGLKKTVGRQPLARWPWTECHCRCRWKAWPRWWQALGVLYIYKYIVYIYIHNMYVCVYFIYILYTIYIHSMSKCIISVISSQVFLWEAIYRWGYVMEMAWVIFHSNVTWYVIDWSWLWLGIPTNHLCACRVSKIGCENMHEQWITTA